ncbi:MAG: FkbM family methyltransferase [Candidatus Parcubacteria bacterium]|nr:FkbM family methyltransferase [Candidatus Parcubacteria bacterium]
MLFTLKNIASKFKFTPKGIIHLGAHIGQEAEDYSFVKHVLWIEGNPDIMPELEKNISKYPGQTAFQALVSDVDGEDVDFQVTSNGQSSSMFALDKMKTLFPDVVVSEKLALKTKRLDTLFKEKHLDPKQYDFLIIDVQGAELKAIEGMGKILESIEWLCVEVNLVKFYHGTPLMHAVDSYLAKKGFRRIETNLKPRQWGDALYHREKMTKCELQKTLLKDYLLEAKILFFFKLRFLRFLRKYLKRG